MFRQSAKNRFSTSEFLDTHVCAALTDDMAVSIAVALIQSRLDYANSVCYGISARNLAKLQRIQNVAAHIVAHHQPKRPSSSCLFNLHWLPIKHRISFKIDTCMCKTGHPGYLLNSLNTYQPFHSLHSIDNHLLAKPSVYTSDFNLTLNSTQRKFIKNGSQKAKSE